MNVLIACEESQRVCLEMRKKGHNAFSCDILASTGGHPEYHIKDNVLKILNGNCTFKTEAGETHKIDDRWDMVIAFPPCTHLAVSGARHFEKKRKDGRQREAIEFFCAILNADTPRLSVENPVNIISGNYVLEHFPDLCEKYNLPLSPTQYIQPYEFGDKARKKTGLWLKGLKALQPTNIVTPDVVTIIKKDGTTTTFSSDYGHHKSGGERSKTYLGVARAMAEQWG